MMTEKSKIIYILVILWIVIGVLFIGTAVQKISEYLNVIDSFGGFGSPDDITKSMTFSYVVYTTQFIIIIALSFILAYSSFRKKSQSWLIGIILSSFLIHFVVQAIYFIGFAIIRENFGLIFSNFEYITYMLMLFIVPCVIFILTRPKVKEYFGKT